MIIATLNCEILFAKYRFSSNLDPQKADGFTINDLAFGLFDETEKQIIAMAIRKVNAEVIALQEVESLPLLDAFNSQYLAGTRYTHPIVFDFHTSTAFTSPSSTAILSDPSELTGTREIELEPDHAAVSKQLVFYQHRIRTICEVT